MKFQLKKSLALTLVLIILAVAVGVSCAQPAPTQPATTQPATTQPATTQAAPTPTTPKTTTPAATQPATTTAATQPATKPATTTAASPAPAQAKVFNIRFQDMTPAGGDNFNTIQKWFIDPINKAGAGRINVQHLGSGSIVPDLEMHTAVRKGTLDMCMAVSMYYSGTFIAAGLDRGYPGQYQIWQDMLFLRYLGFTDTLREAYKDVLGVYYVDSAIDWGGDMVSTKPMNSLAEAKGKKIRAGGSLGQVLGKAGASVVVIPGTEIYTAMQTGVIEAAIYGKFIDASQLGLNEIAKYVIADLIGPQFGGSLMVNLDTWNSLTPDLQQIIKLAADSYFNQGNVENIWKGNQKLAEFKAKGGTVIRWSKADFEALSKISDELVNELIAKDPKWTPKLVEIIKKMMAGR